MLFMSQKFSKLIQTRETLTFLLQNFGFVINLIPENEIGFTCSDNQLKVNDFNFAARSSSGHSEQVWITIDFPKNISNGVNEALRKNGFHKTSCSPEKNLKQLSAESSNWGNHKDKLISRKKFFCLQRPEHN